MSRQSAGQHEHLSAAIFIDTPGCGLSVAGDFRERQMNGFLLVAVYLHHEVPLRVYDDHGQHAAQIEADELDRHPERLLERYRQAHDAIAPDTPEFPLSEDGAPLFFDVLRITNGQVGELVYCTEDSTGTGWDCDHD